MRSERARVRMVFGVAMDGEEALQEAELGWDGNASSDLVIKM